MMWDLLIVGAGPAGITAAIYAARKRLHTVVVSRDIGGQAAASWDVENYTGYQMITGPELAAKFKEHLEKFGLPVHEGETVMRVATDGSGFLVQTERGEYRARTVIVASGRTPRRLGVPGEEEFRNRGVTWCATCDGPLFAGQRVAVVGGGNAGFDAALQLLKIASSVTVIDVAERLRADPVMVEKARAGGAELLFPATVQRIIGDQFVTGIEVVTADGLRTLPVEGVFVEIGSTAVSDFVEKAARNAAGELLVNPRCETDVPGLFAAGDVTDVFSKQIVVACGEGAKAAIAAAEYVGRLS